MLSKIKTRRLSRFILDYSHALISSVSFVHRYKADNNKLYGIIIDFAKQRAIGLSQWLSDCDEEKDRQREILHSFIVQIFELFFREKSNHWSLRYYRLINPHKISFQRDKHDVHFDGMVNSLKNIAVDTNFDLAISWKLGSILEIKNNSTEYRSKTRTLNKINLF